jgi:hypothetical protein
MRQGSLPKRLSLVRKCHLFGLDQHPVFKPVALPDVNTGVRTGLIPRAAAMVSLLGKLYGGKLRDGVESLIYGMATDRTRAAMSEGGMLQP